MKLIQNKKFQTALFAVFALALSGTAFAAAGAAGGLTTAQTTATTVQTALFAFVGACAGIYLLYLGLMAWADKKTWADFGMGVVYVALVGGSVALATWAWALFSS